MTIFSASYALGTLAGMSPIEGIPLGQPQTGPRPQMGDIPAGVPSVDKF